MKVLDRHDRRWKVRRRWLPWRRRVRDVPDVPIDGGIGDDPISMILGLIVLVVAIPALLVVLLVLAELLLLLVLLPVFVVVRLVLPVPWTIELWSRPARRRVLGWHLEHEVPVRGWRASRERIRALSTEVAARRELDYVPEGRTGPDRPVVDAVEESVDRPVRRPGDGAPPASPGDEVAAGSPAAQARPAATGEQDPQPNPFAQRGER